jgi:hypothetical protein
MLTAVAVGTMEDYYARPSSEHLSTRHVHRLHSSHAPSTGNSCKAGTMSRCSTLIKREAQLKILLKLLV